MPEEIELDNTAICNIAVNQVKPYEGIYKTLMRKYDLINGSITIDDIPINELTKKSLRTNISIVKQDSYIFNMSIKDNLRLVDENISDQQIEDVCKLVCMDKFIFTSRTCEWSSNYSPYSPLFF